MIIEFTPSTTARFEFTATMDGVSHRVSTPWSLFGARFYVNMNRSDGTPVFALPLIGSPMPRRIEAVTWYRGKLDITLVQRHGYEIGQTVNLTVRGCEPVALNGWWQMLVPDERGLAFALPVDPGPVTRLGIVSHDINIASGYFAQSTLVYRRKSAQFEVSP